MSILLTTERKNNVDFKNFICTSLNRFQDIQDFENSTCAMLKLTEAFGNNLEKIKDANIYEIFEVLCLGVCGDYYFDTAKTYLKLLFDYMDDECMYVPEDIIEENMRSTYLGYLSWVYPKIIKSSLDEWIININKNTENSSIDKNFVKLIQLYTVVLWYYDSSIACGIGLSEFDKSRGMLGEYKLTKLQSNVIEEGLKLKSFIHPETKEKCMITNDEFIFRTHCEKDTSYIDDILYVYNSLSKGLHYSNYLNPEVLQANRTFNEVFEEEKKEKFSLDEEIIGELLGSKRYNYNRWNYWRKQMITRNRLLCIYLNSVRSFLLEKEAS